MKAKLALMFSIVVLYLGAMACNGFLDRLDAPLDSEEAGIDARLMGATRIKVAFTATTTWIAPGGVTRAEICCCGSGGGGGGGSGGSVSNGQAGTGGGGGGTAVWRCYNENITPGAQYDINIGASAAGGSGGCPDSGTCKNGSLGTIGNDTTFEVNSTSKNLVTCIGAGAGFPGTQSLSPTAGIGGWFTKYNGSNAGDSIPTGLPGTGGAGGAIAVAGVQASSPDSINGINAGPTDYQGGVGGYGGTATVTGGGGGGGGGGIFANGAYGGDGGAGTPTAGSNGAAGVANTCQGGGGGGGGGVNTGGGHSSDGGNGGPSGSGYLELDYTQ